MSFKLLLIQNRKSFVVLQLLRRRFLNLERLVSFIRLFHVIKSRSVLLENRTLARQFGVFTLSESIGVPLEALRVLVDIFRVNLDSFGASSGMDSSDRLALL